MRKSDDCKKNKVRKNLKNCFNVIYENDTNIIPEIDDTELLNFGMIFMSIRARELNKIN